VTLKVRHGTGNRFLSTRNILTVSYSGMIRITHRNNDTAIMSGIPMTSRRGVATSRGDSTQFVYGIGTIADKVRIGPLPV
jgi:hypothetical protein